MCLNKHCDWHGTKSVFLRVNLDGWAEACNVLHRRYELRDGDIIDGRHGVAHHDHLTAKPQEFPTNSAETISRNCNPMLPVAVMNGTEHLLCCAMLFYGYAMLCLAVLCRAVLGPAVLLLRLRTYCERTMLNRMCGKHSGCYLTG